MSASLAGLSESTEMAWAFILAFFVWVILALEVVSSACFRLCCLELALAVQRSKDRSQL